jgi:hypothetical protein
MRDSLLRPSSDERLPCRPARTIKLARTTRFDPTARLRSLAGGAAARLTRSWVAVLYLYVSQPRSSAYECTVGQTLLVPLGLAACLQGPSRSTSSTGRFGVPALLRCTTGTGLKRPIRGRARLTPACESTRDLTLGPRAGFAESIDGPTYTTQNGTCASFSQFQPT